MPPIRKTATVLSPSALREHVVQITAAADLERAAAERGISLDAAAAAEHIMAPAHTRDVVSSHGLLEGPRLAPIPHLDIAARLLRFDDAGFAADLHDALKDEVAGYAMALRRNGTTLQARAHNWAKLPADGSESWAGAVRMHVASVSKLVTAIATTRLLDAHGISYDAPIAPYLPVYWAKGPNVDKITFRQLMTHTSGFKTDSSSSDFAFMKDKVAAGVTSANLGQYDYENMNFGLCRILIATINGNVAPGAQFDIPFIADGNDLFWDVLTIAAYRGYVEEHVFTPAGVSGPTFDHPGADALAYAFPTGSGWNSGDLASMSGGAGWHMSVDDLLAVMATFRRAGSIMTKARAQAMLDNGFGIDLVAQTPLGTLYNKNGLWRDGAKRTEQSLAYFLPQNTELVVLANSPIGTADAFFRTLVTDIYTTNIKPRPVTLEPGAKIGALRGQG